MADSRTLQRLTAHLSRLVDAAGVPGGEIVFLHVRLRGLRRRFPLAYPQIAEAVLRVLGDRLAPRTVLVPAYTNASFRYTGIYHRLYSRSEVGRFSEEVRARFTTHRTPDPIYSLSDTGDYLATLEAIDYGTTWGPGSLFDRLDEEDYVILNLGLEQLYSTQIHAAERAAAVPYRFDTRVRGVVYLDEHEHREVDYRTYLLDSPSIGVTTPEWDRGRIEHELVGRGIVRRTALGTTRLLWCRSRELTGRLTDILRRDSDFLLREPYLPAPAATAGA